MKIKIALLTATIIAFSVPWVGYAQSNESLSVDTNGNVGVGTIAPVAPLEIVHDGGEQPVFQIDASGYNLYANDTVPLADFYVNGIQRHRFGANGKQYLSLRDARGEVGEIRLATPNGRPGIIINTGSPGNYSNRWQIENYGFYTELRYNDQDFGSGLVFSKDGKIGIGTRFPLSLLHVQGEITANSVLQLSSRRWKSNIHPLEDALHLVKQLNGVRYDSQETGEADIGFIAEDVGQVLPEIVTFESNGVDARSINYSKITAVLVEAVKEQQAQIRALQEDVQQLRMERAQ